MDIIPPCKEKRTLFNLFDIYDCKKCKLLRKDEFYTIGEINFNIYHLNDLCILNETLELDDFINSNKMKLFLKDAIINQCNNIILWLDEFDIEKDEDDFYNLLAFQKDIQIIVF